MANLSKRLWNRNIKRVEPLHMAMTEVLENRRLLAAFYVDALSPGPLQDGSSWENAYADLQQALGATQPGDQIHVAKGTYKPTSGADQTLSFQLKSDVAIYGGYAGNSGANPDARDPAANRSVLSGNIGSVGSNLDNSYHVVLGNGANASAILDGFTLMGGNANGTGIDQIGGGMLNFSSSPTLVNCTFNGNSASRGGAMYNDDSSPTLINCTFINNSGTYGGGVENGSNSDPKLINCAFSGNSASQFGGAMYNESSSSASLVNCTLSGNSAGYSGGAIYSSTLSSPTLTNCIVWGNTAQSGAQFYPASGTVTVTFSDIQNGFNGNGNFALTPFFVRAPSTGLDEVWGTADDDYGDLRLRPSSPCIDVGSNAAVSSDILTDLQGNPRLVNVPGIRDPGNIVDMGAYEIPAEAMPTLSINNGTMTEGRFTAVYLTLTLSSASDQTVTVQYTTVDNTAFAPGDYTAASGTITFNPGETTKTLNIQPLVIDDMVHEETEYFSIVLSSLGNVYITSGTATVAIEDNDAGPAPTMPTISIDDAMVNEHKTGMTAMVFTVTLSAASSETITVQYATANKTAKAPGDYTSASGSITFAPGETVKTVNVLVAGDGVIEKNETFKVNLTSPINASFSDAQGIGTIANDDYSKVPNIKVVLLNPSKTITTGQSTKVSFGSALMGTTGSTKVFRVTNTGTATLKLGKVLVPAGYKLMNGLSSTLAPGKSDTFSIKPITKKTGIYPGSVSFTTNIAGKTTFIFPITVTIKAKKA